MGGGDEQPRSGAERAGRVLACASVRAQPERRRPSRRWDTAAGSRPAARRGRAARRDLDRLLHPPGAGRTNPSTPVLASLARVLHLDDDQRTYMYELAGTPAKSRRRAPQRVKPYLQRLLDRIDAPAIVMTPTHDILAWNPLAAALMVDFAEIPERERNFMRLLFTDPRMRSLYPRVGRARAIGRLLHPNGSSAQARRPPPRRTRRRPLDPRRPVPPMVGRHLRRRQTTRRPQVQPPVVGEITLEWDALTSDAEPDQQLIVYTAEPGSRSEQALRDLAAWADQHVGPSSNGRYQH
jgi:MmyB-like transcription regulator ligand binding domain